MSVTACAQSDPGTSLIVSTPPTPNRCIDVYACSNCRPVNFDLNRFLRWWNQVITGLDVQIGWSFMPMNQHNFSYSLNRTANTLSPVSHLITAHVTLMPLVAWAQFTARVHCNDWKDQKRNKWVLFRSWRTRAGPFESLMWTGAYFADLHVKRFEGTSHALHERLRPPWKKRIHTWSRILNNKHGEEEQEERQQWTSEKADSNMTFYCDKSLVLKTIFHWVHFGAWHLQARVQKRL